MKDNIKRNKPFIEDTFLKKCKCGHRQYVPYSTKDYAICGVCGRRLYNNKEDQEQYNRINNRDEFRYLAEKAISEIKGKLLSTVKNIQTNQQIKKKSFNSNEKYFKFLKDNHINVIDMQITGDRIIIKYVIKKGRPNKKER
jgi:hypothetical protein